MADQDEPTRGTQGNARPLTGVFPVAVGASIGLAILALGSSLLPFVIGFLFAILLSPFRDIIEHQGAKRPLSAALASIFSALVLLLTLFGLSWTLTVFLTHVSEISTELWPRLLERAAELLPPNMLSGVSLTPPAILTDPLSTVSSSEVPIFGPVLSLTGSLMNFALLVLLTPFVTYFLLFDSEKLLDRLMGTISPAQMEESHDFWQKAKPRLFNALIGQLLISFIQFLLYLLGYLVIGLNWAIPLALISGLARLVPILGGAISFAMVMTMGFMQFDSWLPLVALLVLHLAMEIFEAGVLSPKVIANRARTHPLLVLATVLIGTNVFGLLGTLVSIPLAAVIGVLLEDLLRNRDMQARASPELPEPDR